MIENIFFAHIYQAIVETCADSAVEIVLIFYEMCVSGQSQGTNLS